MFQLGVAPEVDAQFLGYFDYVQEVAWRAGDGGSSEVAHQHELLFGIAGGSRHNRAAEMLAAIMKPEPASEESVTITYLQNILIGKPIHSECARGGVCPYFDIAASIGNANRLAGSSGGTMEADDFLKRCGGEAGWVLIAQIRLFHEGELGDIRERYDIAGLDAFFVATSAE